MFCHEDKKNYILSEIQANRIFREMEKRIFQEMKINCYDREDFLQTYSWAVPNKDAIFKLVDFAKGKTILEIGSGLGLWAALLRFYGVDIIATDKHMPQMNPYFYEKKKLYLPYTDIIYMDVCDAIDTYKTDILFLCWPPFDEDIAEYAISNFKGQYVIYIGESRGRSTANDNFFDILEREWEYIKLEPYIYIKSLPFVYDSIQIYKRKT